MLRKTTSPFPKPLDHAGMGIAAPRNSESEALSRSRPGLRPSGGDSPRYASAKRVREPGFDRRMSEVLRCVPSVMSDVLSRVWAGWTLSSNHLAASRELQTRAVVRTEPAIGQCSDTLACGLLVDR